MQPAMGLGIAASKTPQPFINRIKSLINHSIFGCGLFLTADYLIFSNRGRLHEIYRNYLP
jgi:formate hydrogenlyase subunit 3/multisubunit Na+/H+ antiporter MnhD subunit